MEQVIRTLIDLQQCDSRMARIRAQREAAPRRIAELEKDLAAKEAAYKEELKRLEALRRERREMEREIEDVASRIVKSQIKLSNIRSNKEYQMALKEIGDLESEKTKKEDRVLELMEELEELEKASRSSKASVEQARKDFEEQRALILKEVEGLGERLKELAEEGRNLRGQLDGALLRRYDSIKGYKGGIAVSPVVKGICQVCHMGIPPQKFNELIRAEALMSCPNCKRLIYWGEDERFQSRDSD